MRKLAKSFRLSLSLHDDIPFVEHAMPLRRPNGFSLPTSTVLIALAGGGAMLGTVPDPANAMATAPLGLVVLPLLGATLWLRRRREHRVAARLRGLRISLARPMAANGMPASGLAFQQTRVGSWRARQDGWQMELRQGHGGQPWQMVLARLDSIDPALPCASAATLDALLRLARGLLPGMGQPSLAALLDCDLCFPLRDSAQRGAGITVLAEGGYALHDPEGCSAISAEAAEGLIRRGSRVPAAPF